MTKKDQNYTVELTAEIYELLQQVKKAFVSYTGEDIDQRSDAKVIDILVGVFFDSMVRGEGDHGHSHADGCCGGGCGCSDDEVKEEGCCGGHCKC